MVEAAGVEVQPVGGCVVTKFFAIDDQAVGVRQDLAQLVVGEVLAGAVRVVNAQHFAVGFAFQRGGVVQRIGHGDKVA
ncbi:hypothetical protein ALQ24_200063 [Pseudomonas syringae pv. antirrhini]|nr:hypothetical protein ALQ24_200063 [Pseudomonas syringae pv. antirrhini]